MSVRTRLERAERLAANRAGSRPGICPACGKPRSEAPRAFMQGEGWSDVDDACKECLPDDRVVITMVGARERPAI